VLAQVAVVIAAALGRNFGETGDSQTEFACDPRCGMFNHFKELP
jgi:hypothetical protein